MRGKTTEIPKWCWVYGFKVVTDERPDVKHRPIIFKATMVRAIMEGRKTQTRRPLKPAPTLRDRVWSWSANRCGEGATWDNSITRGLERMLRRWSPFGQVGDRLWVKETWAEHPDGDGIIYRATDPGWDDSGSGLKWKSSMSMPRTASRLTLEILSVRVERVEAISEVDGA